MKIITKTVVIIALIILLISTTLSFSFILFLINRGVLVDTNNVDIFEIILRASFVFLGSTLSGFVALFVFFLNKFFENKERERIESKYSTALNNEFDNNKKVISSIKSSIDGSSSESLAAEIPNKSSSLNELLLIQYTKINVDIFENYVEHLSEDDYLTYVEKWKTIIKIHNYLKLLLDDIHDKENAVTVIEALKKEIASL